MAEAALVHLSRRRLSAPVMLGLSSQRDGKKSLPVDLPVRILRPSDQLDYDDSRSVVLPSAMTPIQDWNFITTEPRPLMSLAFRMGDSIAARFGVKAIGGLSGERRIQARAGETLDFFLVEHSAPDMLVLTVRDRRLDVMICLATSGRRLTITSSVVVHNAFGWVYMVLVAPIHRLILAADLRRLTNSLGQEAVRPRYVGRSFEQGRRSINDADDAAVLLRPCLIPKENGAPRGTPFYSIQGPSEDGPLCICLRRRVPGASARSAAGCNRGRAALRQCALRGAAKI